MDCSSRGREPPEDAVWKEKLYRTLRASGEMQTAVEDTTGGHTSDTEVVHPSTVTLRKPMPRFLEVDGHVCKGITHASGKENEIYIGSSENSQLLISKSK